ncbi:GyrI-like domain-containing protein [Gordonia shandongensis]|uniref:GyrI-like domain-containing protein n=1 Tax=Gordonia shandongensis TaxID=376351 RepID=UPI000416EC79|nr:GyrI-like domain-containing protein [Gordonia shandongensis]
MTSSASLVLREDPYFEATEIQLPSGVPTVTVEFFDETLSGLPEIFDSAFGALAEAGPVGPGFAVYVGDVTDTFDLTVGFPVAEPVDVTDLDGVANAEFPAGRALVMSHLGGFDGLGSAWETLLETHRVTRGSAPRALIEIYVTDPSAIAHDDLRTDLLVVL